MKRREVPSYLSPRLKGLDKPQADYVVSLWRRWGIWPSIWIDFFLSVNEEKIQNGH